MSGGKKLGADQRLILVLMALMLLLIVGVTVLAPRQGEDSAVPSSENTGPLGVKAAYLTLEELGHTTSRWKKSLAALNDSMNDAQAARTTLVLLEPAYDATEEAELKAQLARFTARGGDLLITGREGARLLGAKTTSPELLQALCRTIPEGDSALAKAGVVQLSDRGGWDLNDKATADLRADFAQRCGKDVVVAGYPAGKGHVIWWTAETPMVNVELKQDSALKLVLASVGYGERDVVFDEAMHELTRDTWDAAKGLPVLWVALQAAALFALLVLSFGRRRGPVRLPVTLPRSSPVEFATSMGDLYEKGEASGAATEAARRRLLRVMTGEVGLAQETVKAGPDAVGEALRARFGEAETSLVENIVAHLKEAQESMHAKVSGKSALALVRAMGEDVERLRTAMEFKGTKE